MERFGFSLQDSYTLPMPQIIDFLADAGFCAVSPVWQHNGDLEAIVRHAQMHGMTVQSLHGPLRGMPTMWGTDRDAARPLLQDLMQSATDCAKFEIPLLVVHPWNGVNYTFCREQLCFDHFDALVKHAENAGIRIAFENLEGPEFLGELMNRYAGSSTVGFCWDSGHEMCFAPGWDFLSLYGERLIMTHLNDNLGVTDPSGKLQGTDDLHLLPGHGIVDWENAVRRLKAAKSQEILNFELKIRPKGDRCKLDLYSRIPLRQYFQEAYDRACAIAKDYFDA